MTTELNLAQASQFWQQKATEAGVAPAPPQKPGVPAALPQAPTVSKAPQQPPVNPAQAFWQRQAEEVKRTQPIVMKEGEPPVETEEGKAAAPASRGVEEFWRQQSIKSKSVPRTVTSKPGASLKRADRARPTTTFATLNEKERTEAYFEMYDKTIQLQKSHTTMEQRVKELTVKLERLEGAAKHERKFGEEMTGLSFKADALPSGNGEVTRLKVQNSQLKQRMERVSMAIKSGKVKGTARRKYSPEGPFVESASLRPKVLVSLVPEEAQKDQIIEKLRNQLLLTEKEFLRVTNGQAPTVPLDEGALRQTGYSLQDMEGRQRDMQEKLTAQQLYCDQVVKRLEAAQVALTEERTKCALLEQRVRTFEMATTGSGDMVMKMDELTQENKRLEAQLRDLCSSPFIREAGDRLGFQSRMSNYESELKANSTAVVRYKEMVLKLEAELAKTREEGRLAVDQQTKLKEELSMFRTRLEEREKYIRDINAKLNMIGGGGDMTEFFNVLGLARLKNEEGLDERLTFLDPKVIAPRDPQGQQRAIEQLKLEKAQLAAELEKTQSLLALREQMEKEKLAMARTDAEQAKAESSSLQLRVQELSRLADYRSNLIASLNTQGKVAVFDESRRDGPRSAIPTDTSEFDFATDDGSEISPGDNVLDLFIISADFYETALSQLLGGLTRIEPGILTMVTLDFYNHETQSTGLSDGLKPVYNINIAFRVAMDEFFVKYLEKEAIALEAHINTGTSHTTFAKGRIQLAELLSSRGRPLDSIAVLLSLDGKTSVGTIHYKMRMRNPMSEMLRAVVPATQPARALDEKSDPIRRLVVTLFKCTGLLGSGAGAQVAPFVYYQFYNEKEVFSAVKSGPDPIIDEVHVHEIRVDAEVRTFLDKEVLEVVVFDDRAPIRTGGQDIIGIAHIPLNPLLIDTAIEGSFGLFNSQGRASGAVVMRISWQDSRVETLGYGTPLTKVWEREVFERIAANLLNRELTLEAAFNVFDQDQDGVVSANEFRNTVLMTLRLPISDHEVSLLVNSFSSSDGSLTKEEFNKKFAGLLPSALGPAVLWEEAIIDKVRDRIREKNLSLRNAFDAFDIDKSGFIDRNEFIRTLEIMQLGLTADEIEKLLRYFDPRDVGRIYFQSFMDKMMAEGSSPPRGRAVHLNPRDVEDKVTRLVGENRVSVIAAMQSVDRNRDGRVTREEFSRGMQQLNLGLTTEEIEVLWDTLAVDAKGQAEIVEFCRRMEALVKVPVTAGHATSSLPKPAAPTAPPTLGEVRHKIISALRGTSRSPLAVFQSWDLDRDNFLSLDEFSNAISALKVGLSEVEVGVLAIAADPRHENRVSIDEWIRLLDPRGNPMDAFKKLAKDSKLNVRDIFMAFDQNKDGNITAMEFQTCMQRMNLGLTSEEIGHIMTQLDVNKDGKIGYRELLALLEPPKPAAPTKRPDPVPDPNMQTDSLKEVVTAIATSGMDLAAAFRVFDKDGDGFISREEFGQVFSDMKLGLTRDQITKLQDRVDKNRDGKISFVEFKALFAGYGIVIAESRLGTSSSTQSISAKKRPMRSVQDIYKLLDEHMRNKGLNVLKFYRQTLDPSNNSMLGKDELVRGLNAVVSPALSDGEAAALLNELCGPGVSRFNFAAFKASFTRFLNTQSGTSLDQSRRALLEATESLSSSFKQTYEERKQSSTLSHKK